MKPPISPPTLVPLPLEFSARGEHVASREIQIGAWRTENEAAAGWVHAVKLAGELLSGVAPSITPAEVPHKGQYFRLRITVKGNATELCEALKDKGAGCMIVTN
jgi:hypothetical protein